MHFGVVSLVGSYYIFTPNKLHHSWLRDIEDTCSGVLVQLPKFKMLLFLSAWLF